MARFVNCHFSETIFPALEEKRYSGRRRLHGVNHLYYLDPHTKQYELEVQKIMHLQEITN